ncbi:MAG TPA: serine hydrolase [Pirellulales bacterium]|nr:serine hydrolase [Pirellulales bacterium]
MNRRCSRLRKSIRAAFAAACLFAANSPLTAGGDEPSPLAQRLTPLIEAHRGRVAVAVKQLESGEGFAHRENEPMPTASLIKFPVLIELYRQAEAGEADLNKTLTLQESDKAPGSGILTSHFSAGASFSLRDAARLMIAFSDNTATNLVLDEIGLPATSETMVRLGYANTQLHNKVFGSRKTSIAPERSAKFGLGSTTAAEMLKLFEALHRKQLVSEAACDQMLKHLQACQDRDRFSRLLPPGTAVAFKTGSVNAARTAAGIIESPSGPIAVCVLTADNEDRRWTRDNAGDVLCARIAQAAFEHFNPSEQREGKVPTSQQ